MSIHINYNLHTQGYNPTAKRGTTATGGFAMPDMKDTSVTETDESESRAGDKIDVDENGMIQNHLRAQVKMLPAGIGMTAAEFVKYHEDRTAKIVFDFGEDGSVRIKEGLSKADYLRAKQSLMEMELWRQGK